MNVVVILADSWRWDHFGFNGNEWIETPSLDEFSKECAIFDNLYTEGLPTLPQRTAAFTGRFTFPFRGWGSLLPTDERISNILMANGVYPALIGDSLPLFMRGAGYTECFAYVQFIAVNRLARCLKSASSVDLSRLYPSGREVNSPHLRNYLKQVASWESEEDHMMAQSVKAAVRWVDGYDRPQPFMLWLDMFDPHEPWLPPEDYWRRYYPDYEGEMLPTAPDMRVDGFYLTEEEARCTRALYAGECTLVDKWIGIFIDHLRSKGLLDESLVIFTSDHGEPLGDGMWGHGLWRKFRPWPYEELAHAPLLVRHPQGNGRGNRFDTFAQSCDIGPTVLDAFGISPTEGMHGKSVLPVVLGEAETVRDFAVAGHHKNSPNLAFGDSRSIRTKEWTYIHWPDRSRELEPEGKLLRNAPELYQRDADLNEQDNVIEEHPEIAQELELKLRRFEDELKAKGW